MARLSEANAVRAGGREFGARRAVVLACGGFEHDPDLRERLLDGPYVHPLTPPVNRGDALRPAGGAGAARRVGERGLQDVGVLPQGAAAESSCR